MRSNVVSMLVPALQSTLYNMNTYCIATARIVQLVLCIQRHLLNCDLHQNQLESLVTKLNRFLVSKHLHALRSTCKCPSHSIVLSRTCKHRSTTDTNRSDLVLQQAEMFYSAVKPFRYSQPPCYLADDWTL